MKNIDQELEEAREKAYSANSAADSAYWVVGSAARSAAISAYYSATGSEVYSASWTALSAAWAAANSVVRSAEWMSAKKQEEINQQINLILELL